MSVLHGRFDAICIFQSRLVSCTCTVQDASNCCKIICMIAIARARGTHCVYVGGVVLNAVDAGAIICERLVRNLSGGLWARELNGHDLQQA